MFWGNECMKRVKQVKRISRKDETVLVDGYYMPKEIAGAYRQLKEYCVLELRKELEKFCHHVRLEVERDVSVLYAVAQETDQLYRFELSPMRVSQIEKAIGTKKLLDYIKEQK